MKTFKGFISEHTAEYFLLAELIPLLSLNFKFVIPFFFWATREGTNMQLNQEVPRSFKLLTIFPRRPKLSAYHENEMLIKFNQTIFPIANHFKSHGIPVVTGTPASDSFLSLDIVNGKNIWFEIISNCQDDINIYLQTRNPKTIEVGSEAIKGPIDINDILNISLKSADNSWQRIKEIVKTSTKIFGDNRYFQPFGGYKPVFILLGL